MVHVLTGSEPRNKSRIAVVNDIHWVNMYSESPSFINVDVSHHDTRLTLLNTKIQKNGERIFTLHLSTILPFNYIYKLEKANTKDGWGSTFLTKIRNLPDMAFKSVEILDETHIL